MSRSSSSHSSIVALIFNALSAIPVAVPVARAQEARLFQNSWFWGVHAGATHIGTRAVSGQSAGTVGAEWMITRSVAGLYVAFDQANFGSTALVADPDATNGVRRVSIHDMRTGSVAGVAFPAEFGSFRPYAGLGYAISVLGSATPQQTTTAQPGTTAAPASTAVQQNIDNASSRAAIFFMGGGQWQRQRYAAFAQVTVMPGQSDFLINKPVTQLSLGVRYNFGAAIER